MRSRVTTTDGRFPGSRVVAFDHLPRDNRSQWLLWPSARRLQVPGQLRNCIPVIAAGARAPHSLGYPLARNHHQHARIGVRTSQEVPLPANLEGLLKMRKLSIIGIGAGNADHITVQAIKALASVDVVFLIGKGNDKEDLAQLRKDLCARYIGKPYRIVEAQDPERDRTPADYETAVTGWHTQRAAIYERMMREELSDDQHGAFLVWGDPSLYDSTLRIVDQVAAMRTVTFELDVIPGITSVQALAARHKIALNRIGGPVHITTGRLLANGMPADDVVVMLDVDGAFKSV